MSKIDQIKNHYEPRIETFEESYRILDWESREAQLLRFQVLPENIPLRNLRILDVGCGMADLCSFLAKKNTQCVYTGVDILEPMVQEARQRHPDADIRYADIFSEKPFADRAFDLVYCCGIFNLNLGNNESFLRRSMPVFERLSAKWVVVNLLHIESPNRDDKYFYFHPKDVEAWFSPLFQSFRIVQGYLPNDFTLVAEVHPDSGVSQSD